MKTIFLSDRVRQAILLMTIVIAGVLFAIPLGIVLYVRSRFGIELEAFYISFAIGVFLIAALPLLVLKFSRQLVPKIGKYGFSFVLSISLVCLLLFNNSGSEKLWLYQWVLAVPLMIGATVYGFFSPQKIILPRLYTPVFFMAVGIFGLLEIVNIIYGWLPSGVILSILLVLFFACLQAGQANILRHRLQKEQICKAEVKVLILNYGLIFAINFCGLLLSAHAMKICLAFMFDNIAAENGKNQNRRFS